MRVTNFSRGLNILKHPSLLNPLESVEFHNIDNTSNTLKPLKSSINSWISADADVYYSNNLDSFLSSNDIRWYTEFGKYTIYSSGTDMYRRRLDTAWTKVGIDEPLHEYKGIELPVTVSYSDINPSTGEIESINQGWSYAYSISYLRKDYANDYGRYDISGEYSQLSPRIKSGRFGVVYIELPSISELETDYRKITHIRVQRNRYYNGEFQDYKGLNAYTHIERLLDIPDKNWGSTEYIYGDGDTLPDLDKHKPVVYQKEEKPRYNVSYCYTFYSSDTGEESMPSLPSKTFDYISSKVIRLDMIQGSEDDRVDKIRIYKIGKPFTEWTLIDELPNHGSSTQYTNYYDMGDAEKALGNVILKYSIPPQEGSKFLTSAYGILFAALDNSLVFSETGDPLNWPSKNKIFLEDDITGIAKISYGLLLFTRYKTYLLSGTSYESFSLSLFDSNQGCINHKTIQHIKTTPLWVSTDGICSVVGDKVSVITRNNLGRQLMDDTINACIFNGIYYLSRQYHDTITIDLEGNLKIGTFSDSGFFVISNDTLYVRKADGYLWKCFTGNNLEFIYKSPILTDQGFSNYKVYKDLYIKYTGNIFVTIYIYKDNNVITAYAKSLPSDKTIHNIKLDNMASGYGLQLKLQGTGEVIEYEFKTQNRQNGR